MDEWEMWERKIRVRNLVFLWSTHYQLKILFILLVFGVGIPESRYLGLYTTGSVHRVVSSPAFPRPKGSSRRRFGRRLQIVPVDARTESRWGKGAIEFLWRLQ